MLTKRLDEYKLSTTNLGVTSFSGLSLFWEMAKSLGLERRLNELRVKVRDRGYRPAETIFSLMGLMLSGGVSLDDIHELNSDEGLRRLMGKFPESNTTGEFLRRFTNRTVHRLGEIVLKTAVGVIRASGLTTVTMDIDAFMLESQKWNATMNYKGEVGFNPVAVTCAELMMPMAGLFRAGNASAMRNLAGLLRRVMSALPGMKIRVRSDSAGYQAKVVRELRSAGADYTITVRQDAAVMETIRGIPATAWKRYEGGAWEKREQEIAETVHAFGDEDIPALRMVMTRWVKRDEHGQGDLVDPYGYHAVITSLEDWPAGLVLQFHRSRQNGSENVNKELSGGIGLSKLPCRSMMANAAYFQVALLSYVVFAAARRLVLPESWRTKTIRTVRFCLIRLAGVVVRTGRRLILNLPERYRYVNVFREARLRIQGMPVHFRRL